MAREKPNLLPRNKKSKPATDALPGQPLVSIGRISTNSSATVVAVQARSGEPLRHRPETAPSPGTHPLGEGVHIRRARHFRLLSGYLIA
jgi:hypothetical protein